MKQLHLIPQYKRVHSIDDKFNVTLSLDHCTASNTSNKTGSTYENTLTASEGYTLSNDAGKVVLTTTVTMDGNNVTGTAFTAATGVISIAEVTGDIVVTVAPQVVGP